MSKADAERLVLRASDGCLIASVRALALGRIRSDIVVCYSVMALLGPSKHS